MRRPWPAALAACLVLLAAGCAGEDPSYDDSGEAPVSAGGEVTQPATLAYGPPRGVEEYAEPGALVVAGRDNYGDRAFRDVAAAGGTVLVYLDPVIDNDHGRYHELLLRESACGPAVAAWPGEPGANEYGDLNDFRPGTVLQDKLRCVLETMVEENPQMGGWFLDDVGSRSYFPETDWESWSAEDQQAYRDGAIEITRTAREVADEHGLIFLVNGTWGAGGLAEAGGGYPDAERPGNALADGGFVENQDENLEYFAPYACDGQWAEDSPVTRGEAVNFAVTETVGARDAYIESGCFAYVQRHDSYEVTVPPWAGFRDRGLPSGVSG
ncbi:hypothetical protein [Nocardioides sp. CFH 31398]|uniref:hypothetical protein n=1 Tax=Nocardioides sp. CFH 31398 TaxID=2919579 RepID=UPI001F069D71|nr:hypothetical protein [Nocardioides sp. CFH 31398]MCH1867663.1 hypothetical protein [Nocardioides sp. CFH 31398]